MEIKGFPDRGMIDILILAVLYLDLHLHILELLVLGLIKELEVMLLDLLDRLQQGEGFTHLVIKPQPEKVSLLII